MGNGNSSQHDINKNLLDTEQENNTSHYEYNHTATNNAYGTHERDNSEYYDDECTNIPCFSFFCPPPKHQHGKRKNTSQSTHLGNIGGLYGLEVEGNQSPGTVRAIPPQNQPQEQYTDNRSNHHHHHQQHHHQQQQRQQYENNNHTNKFFNGNWMNSAQPKSIVSNNSDDAIDSEQQFKNKYQMCEVLGVGSTSICHRCVNKQTGASFACKIIDKQQIESRFAGMMEQFRSEIDALRKLQHPNIIKLYDVFFTKKKMYIVMELMGGGELFDYVVQKGTLTEAEASVIVRMVTSALVYMHECNIIHRDLKPENLLLKYKPNSIYDLEVKIIDFGLSKRMNQDNNLAQTFLGTRGYLAPEMIQRRQYSRAVDAWALGVIVFVLLCGCLPFDDDSTILSDDAIQAKFTLRFPRWARNLSPSAKDLLSKLLDVNASTRYTAEEALGHPWICGTTAPKDAMLQSPGKIMLTPGKKKNPTKVAAANRTQMNEMIKNRARANSLTRNHARANSTARSRANSNARARDNSNPRPQILVREKSI